MVVVGQRKLLQRLVPGLMHAFIFWAFIVLFPAIFIAMIEIVDADCGALTGRGTTRCRTCSACSR